MFDRSIPFDPIVEMACGVDAEGEPIPSERWESERGFTLQWAAKGWGFGTVDFGRREELDGKLHCGDEYMGLANAERVLRRYAEATPREEWTPLLKAYGSVEALMADVVDWESKLRSEQK